MHCRGVILIRAILQKEEKRKEDGKKEKGGKKEKEERRARQLSLSVNNSYWGTLNKADSASGASGAPDVGGLPFWLPPPTLQINCSGQ